MDQRITPTEIAHQELSRAFDALNAALFEGELPSCLITLQRGRASRGYFAAHRFIRVDATTTHEIAINPQIFALATLPEVLSEVAHNMVHLWSYVHGVAGRRGYHSLGWAKKMESLGLIPTHTGLPGGRKVGEKVQHYIIEGGRFAQVAAAMVDDGFNITWLDRVAAPWTDGIEQHEGRGHLLGEALLGKTGLLVDSHDEEEPDLDESPFSAAPSNAADAAEASPASRHDGSASIDHGVMGAGGVDDDEEEPDPWDRGWSAQDAQRALPTHSTGTASEGGESPAGAPVESADAKVKARGDDEPRPVPLIMRAGEDPDGKRSGKRSDKIRFTCPSCSQKAWAKGSAKLDCGNCKVAMNPPEAGSD